MQDQRQALHKRIEANPELKAAKAEAVEVVLDNCESKAYELAMAGDTKMIGCYCSLLER